MRICPVRGARGAGDFRRGAPPTPQRYTRAPRPCTCVAHTQRTARVRPRPGVLTQPAAHSPPLGADAAADAAAEKGETRSPPEPARQLPEATAALPPPSRNGNCGVHDWTKRGEVGPEGGTWGPRCRARARSSRSNWKEPVLPAESPAPPGTVPSAPHPAPHKRSGRGPGWARRGAACDEDGGRGAPAGRVQAPPDQPAFPAGSGARRRGPRGQARRAAPGLGGAPRTPGVRAGEGPRGTATPLPSVTPGLAPGGRAPGAGRVHVGRRARSRQAPSSAALAAHGRRRRAPEAGGDRLQPVQDRREAETRGQGLGSRTHDPGAGGCGEGKGAPGCPGRGSMWGVGAGRGGRVLGTLL